MRLRFAISACLLLLAFQPALAAWAVAQSDSGQPFVRRFNTPDHSREAALDACGQSNQSCRLVVEGGSGCVAIATTGSQWGVAKAGTRPRALAAALDICERLGAGACRIEHEFCGQ
jgi:hypothetical protein